MLHPDIFRLKFLRMEQEALITFATDAQREKFVKNNDTSA